MTEETKMILDEIRSLKTDVSDMRAEASALKADMSEVKADISGMKEEIRNINLVLENDISKRIDIIGEGHDFINRRLDRALLRESHWERIELEIISLRTDTRMIKKHLNIA